MEPKLYEERCKHESLPLDYQYQDAEGYASNWEYIKENHSSYHYDKWKVEQEGEWYNRLGRFDLSDKIPDMIPDFIEQSKKVGWFDVTSTYHPGFPGGKSPLLALEDHDRKLSGIQGEYTQVIPETDMCHIPEIQKMGEYWKLKRLRTRIHVQMPGQMFALHVDKLWHRFPNDPKKLIRMVINLQDYEPGQLMLYGNSIFTQWRAGEIHCFDTLNTPHATCNLSNLPRTMMVVTGVRTDETDEILRNSNIDTIHKYL